MDYQHLQIVKEYPKVDPKEIARAKFFQDTSKHHHDVKYPHVIFCGYTRKCEAEEMEDFADGNGNSETAVLIAETYWIIDNKEIVYTARKKYEYSCNAHSGGVDDIGLRSEKLYAKYWCWPSSWVNNPEINNNIKLFTLILASSRYEKKNMLEVWKDSEKDDFFTKKIRYVVKKVTNEVLHNERKIPCDSF